MKEVPNVARTPLRLPLETRATRSSEAPWKLALALVAVVATCVLAKLDQPHHALWISLAILAIATFSSLALTRLWNHQGRFGHAWLVIDDEEIARAHRGLRSERGPRTPLARWDAPFGVSVLANAARTRVILAFTTRTATRFLGLRVETQGDADVARDLLERAITVGDLDLEIAVGAGGDVELGAVAARAFLTELDRRDPQAIHRIYLTDARGLEIAVERERLVIGDRTIDLNAPVDWRVFTFHEGDPQVESLYQATSIRQGAVEAVLVCRAPSDVASWGGGRTDPPPARESRVAVDGLFMTPLRARLAEAPRVSRPPTPPSRERGRDVLT